MRLIEAFEETAGFQTYPDEAMVLLGAGDGEYDELVDGVRYELLQQAMVAFGLAGIPQEFADFIMDARRCEVITSVLVACLTVGLVTGVMWARDQDLGMPAVAPEPAPAAPSRVERPPVKGEAWILREVRAPEGSRDQRVAWALATRPNAALKVIEFPAPTPSGRMQGNLWVQLGAGAVHEVPLTQLLERWERA